MGCFASKPANVPPDSVPERATAGPVTLPVPSSMPPPSVPEPSPLPSHDQKESTKSTQSKHPPARPRTESAPPPLPSVKLLSPGLVKQVMSQQSSTSKGPPVSILPTQTLSRAVTRTLPSTVRQALSNCNKFRILVVGMKGSGKSSLINAVFKVDTSAVFGIIKQEITCDDNRYLVFHEGPGFGPGDDKNLQRIRDFILRRTDPGCSSPERLHAVWICVPATGAMDGSIGEGVEEILSMKGVPVIVAFTKFDEAVANEGGNSARTKPRAKIEQACRSLLHRDPRDVPAEIVSVRQGFSDLIDNLVAATDRVMAGSGAASTPSERWRVQGAKPRSAPVPLLWSAALRVNQDIFIQTSIEVGRSRYWRSLWNSLDFADQPLKECVNVIHTDIVEIWNLNIKTRYLSGSEFKAKMSHVVRDLAGSVGSVPSSPDFAEWVYDIYGGSQENVRCVMGYIVDLTVILDALFRLAAGNVSINDVQKAMDTHVRAGRRDRIHGDINSFVTETFERFTESQRDIILEKIIDLIRRYCVPPSTRGYS